MALLPLLQIHTQAASLAAGVLPRRQATELELAFRGDGRGAFSWLQCFIAEEADWCATLGCPACVGLRVLHSEPFIRIIVVACRLSHHLQSSMNESGPQLPNFHFVIEATARAVETDDFWGPEFWEEIDGRAYHLEASVKELTRQCCEIRDAPQLQQRCISAKAATCRVKTSKIADRQLYLKREEQDWIGFIVKGVWSAILADAAQRGRDVHLSGESIAPPRMRSLTA